MQPKEPTFDRPAVDADRSAADPAFTRRQRLLGGQASAGGSAVHSGGEPRQPTLLPEAELESAAPEPDPDIPPPPGAAPYRVVRSGPSPAATSPRARRRLLYLGSMAAVLLVALGWWLLPAWQEAGERGEVPLVLAEAGPEKVRPEEEGGMRVPNQDIRIYNELTGQPMPAEPEVLLPRPEAPMTLPIKAPSDPAVTAPPEPTAAETPAAPLAPAPEGEVAPTAGTASAEPPEATSDRPAVAAEPEKQPAQTAAAGGAFRIQLAAMRSPAAAEAAWTKMTKAHPEILEGLSLKVVKVERGSEGAFYRVQGGPLADRAAAEALCGRLKQKDQPCLVVAP